MNHPSTRLRLLPLVLLSVLPLAASVGHAGTAVLAYGGAGVYPQQASGNSERYFRIDISWADKEAFSSSSAFLLDKTASSSL